MIFIQGRANRVLAICVGFGIQLLTVSWYFVYGLFSHMAILASIVLFPLGVFIMCTGLISSRDEIPSSFFLYIALSFFLPVFGAVGSLVIRLYHRYKANQAAVSDIVMEGYSVTDIDDDVSIQETIQRVDMKKLVHRELMVQPYFDIMQGPNRNLKKTLISKILNEWTPHGVELLKTALGDIDYDIRSYAATGLRAIEDQINERILELKEQLRAEPENVEIKLQLSRNYVYLVRRSIADPGLAENYLEICNNILQEARRTAVGDEKQVLEILSVQAHVARLSNNQKEEERLYREILNINPMNVEILAGMCYLQFDKRDFRSLTTACKTFLNASPVNHPIAHAARLWIDREHG